MQVIIIIIKKPIIRKTNIIAITLIQKIVYVIIIFVKITFSIICIMTSPNICIEDQIKNKPML